jgi:hypothetical protein
MAMFFGIKGTELKKTKPVVALEENMRQVPAVQMASVANESTLLDTTALLQYYFSLSTAAKSDFRST